MAAPAEVITDARPSAISLRWIINGREDLIWFIGSVLSSYALLLLYIKGIVPLVPMVALWAILIDAPHVFGTFSRTYFDRTERRNRARLLWGSLLFFAVGPLMVYFGGGLIFFFLAALWAYYHLVKQHYGFMVLYKKKNGDLAPVDNALDRLLLLFAFNYPFVAFIAQDPEAMARVPAALQSGVNHECERRRKPRARTPFTSSAAKRFESALSAGAPGMRSRKSAAEAGQPDPLTKALRFD
jgi:hypothetical protein